MGTRDGLEQALRGATGARPGRRGTWRAARLGALGLLALGASGAASAEPAGPRLRVLLMDAEPSLEIATGRNGLSIRIEQRGGQILANARPAGTVWRAEAGAGGPIAVGDLRVRGRLEVRPGRGGLRVINEVGLEDYVGGTVGREMYSSWHPEALKAQAVAARTYALYRRARSGSKAFDLEASTAGQVYGGVAAETATAAAAARSTAGEILTYGGKPLLAVYHSSSGGRSASAGEVWGRALPYLASRSVDHEEDSPDTYWRASVSRTTLTRTLIPLGIRVGPIREVRVTRRSRSGRARDIEIRGRDGTQIVRARDLRRAVGASLIRSTLFDVRPRAARSRDPVRSRASEAGGVSPAAEKFVFVGSGSGHGVGMSQWGAQGMALRGADYSEILAAFYPGSALRTSAAAGATRRVAAGGSR